MARRDEVVRRLLAAEPDSTFALGALLAPRRPRLETRVLSVGPAARSLAVVARAEPGVWYAYPLLGTAQDAAPLGRAIDRSPAVAVRGPSPHVEPLLAHLRRVVAVQSTGRISVPAPFDWEAPAAGTRVASPLDGPALADLYAGYELPFRWTERAFRRALAEAVRRNAVVVVDGDRRLDGAIVATAVTPRFLEWAMLTVRPDARGRGHSWALVTRAGAVTAAAALGFMAVVAPSNPMTLPDWIGAIDTVTQVDLWLPDRLPGERRLRRLWMTVSQERPRRPL